ncbi:protein of unknown function [Cupriavidus taiwanensis]|nr:protein of unknown function [Cupriavidus taiwanensis]
MAARGPRHEETAALAAVFFRPAADCRFFGILGACGAAPRANDTVKRMIKLIVGLGNPGAEYEATRHNAGFWLVDQLARMGGATLRVEGRFHGLAARARLWDQEVWLLKPSTFMNRSGWRWCRWRASTRSCPTRSWSCMTRWTCRPARPSSSAAVARAATTG